MKKSTISFLLSIFLMIVYGINQKLDFLIMGCYAGIIGQLQELQEKV